MNLLDLARDLDRGSGLTLLSAFLILSAMFLFHQLAKRREAKARTEAAEQATTQAESRFAEMAQVEAKYQEAKARAEAAEQRAIRAESGLTEMERLEASHREAKARAEAAEQRARRAESGLTAMERLEAQYRETQARAEAAGQRAALAESRLTELERLERFGQALGRTVDVEAVRDVVLQHLPQLVGTEDAWVMTRIEGRWHALLSGTRERRPEIDRMHERIADRALATETEPWKTDSFSAEGHLCVPMTVSGQPVGVLGVPESAGCFTESRHRAVAAAATLLGISLRNAQLLHQVHEHSVRDGLTECFNRTYALATIETELRRARRSQLPVSLIIFDLDHFKQINDQYGHLCGDAVLAAVGARIRQLLRISDLKCRFGGEEFLVLLPDTALEGAKRVAHTLRRELAEMTVQWKEEPLTITASFGVTTARPAEVDGKALLARADEALYRAKEQGRNCVRLSIETAVA